MGSGIRFDEIETDIGTSFPTHFVVLVSLYVSSLTQIDSKSKTEVFKHLLILSVWNSEGIQHFKEGFS